MLFEDLKKYKIYLASKSPRRQFLLKDLGLDFEIKIKEVEENYPDNLIANQIPIFLAEKKANAFKDEIKENEIIITADTIVLVGNKVLNKPDNYSDAVRMLQLLSGKKHEVYTGVCLKSNYKMVSFYVVTNVYFKILSLKEIEFYINNYKPYDKAGAYGAQEFIGYIGIEKIEGSYFNVMGLPLKELYEYLIDF